MSRKMKDSGIEWIGEIPEDWEVNKVKKYYHMEIGFTPDTKNEEYYDDDNTGYDWITISDLNGKRYIPSTTKRKISKLFLDEHKPNSIPKGSLLYSFKLSVGQVAFADREVYSNEAIASFFMDNSIDLNFLFYSSYMIVENANENIYGAKILNQDLIKNAYIVFPPLLDQQKIANFLDEKVGEIDTIIEKTKESIEEYKKYKQAVITETVTKGLNPNVEMKDSGIEWIGEIPKDWDVRKIKLYTNIISKGATPKDISTIKTNEYKIRYLKSENIVENKLVSLPEFYITESVHDSLQRSKLSENDIMFVIAGASIGKVAMMDTDFLPSNTNQAMAFLRIKTEYYEFIKYIWYFLQSNIVSSVITLFSVQSAQPNLSMENLGNIRMPVSTNISELYSIIEYLDMKCSKIDTLITKKEELIKELETYKKSLIYEYVTGKKEVE